MFRLYCFTKSKSIPPLWLAVLLVACATQPTEPVVDAASGIENPDGKAGPMDGEVMYRVLAGELLGADGDLEKSAAEYLAAALESEDPAIAERATRVAVAGQSWHYAAMAADRWVVLDPTSLDARQSAIRAMLLTGDYVGAEHQMSRLLEFLVADPTRAWTLIATHLAAAPNPEKASAVLRRLIEENGATENADALFAQSQLMARTGDLAAADELAEQAVAIEPERAELHAWAGRLAVNLQELDRGIGHYRRAHELKPRDRVIALAYAELLKRNDQVDAALGILAALPDSAETRFARIAFALAADQAGEAERIYGGFADSDYANPMEAAFHAARAAEMLDRNQEAIGWYEKITDGDRALFAVLRRASLLAEQGNVQDARNLLARTRLHRDPEIQRETLLVESQLLLQADRVEEAFELLSAALESLPGDTQVLYNRALIAVRLGHIGLAEQDLRAILVDEPDNASALNALGYTLADETDRLEEAARLIRTAYRLQPDEPSIIDSMGWVAYRQGRLEEALSYLEEAWMRDNNPEIAAHLGEVLWALGRKEEARAAWRRGQEQDADNDVLRATLARFGVEF